MKRERETCGLWEAERGTRKRIPAPADRNPQSRIPNVSRSRTRLRSRARVRSHQPSSHSKRIQLN